MMSARRVTKTNITKIVRNEPRYLQLSISKIVAEVEVSGGQYSKRGNENREQKSKSKRKNKTRTGN